MADVSINGLTKSYPNGYVALKGIDLQIRSGELAVLVGPSGCGKTTLLRTIAGLEEASAGSVRIGGQDVTAVSPGDRGIAMVFQDYALYPHMTVKENLAFGLKMRKMGAADIERRIGEACTILGIEPFLERRPAQLSGGQRQRVAIGRAIVKHPKVFLFDEPLSNLDAQLRLRMRTEIGALHRRLGATSVYVTHDQAEAMTLADQIVIMNGGKIVQEGSPLDVYHRPANRFVASFIGSPEMNLLEGEIGTESGGSVFRHLGQSIAIPTEAARGVSGRAVLGFRPESVFVARLGAPATLSAKAVRVESHGHETHLVAELAGTPLVLRSAVPEVMGGLEKLRPGDVVGFTIDARDLHWFAAGGDGRRITPS